MGFFKFKKQKEEIQEIKKLEEEAKFLAPQYLRHVNESIDLINTTKNPETFFFRYDILIERLEQLTAFEGLIDFTGEAPSIALKRVVSEKPLIINAFLDRYYEDVLLKASNLKTSPARQRRVENFVLSMEPYLDQLDEENINKLNELVLILEDELSLL